MGACELSEVPGEEEMKELNNWLTLGVNLFALGLLSWSAWHGWKMARRRRRFDRRMSLHAQLMRQAERAFVGGNDALAIDFVQQASEVWAGVEKDL